MWLLIVGSLVATTVTSASAGCRLDLSPPRVVVAYGDSFSVNCSSSDNQSTGMGWETPLGGIGFKPGASFLTLKIDNVNLWKLNPMCYSSLSDGSQCIEQLPVTVYKMPDSVSMSTPTEMDQLVEGRSYQLMCNVTNVAPAQSLTVTWRKANKLITEPLIPHVETIPSPVNKTSVYFMKVNREDNRAQVWCEAKLNVMPSGAELPIMRSQTHVVTVLYPPTFIGSQNDTWVLMQDRRVISLDCTSSGNPPPVYNWSFPEPIEQLDKFKNDERLVLDHFLQFPGTYGCTASNNQGSRTKHFTIVEPPRDRSTFAAIVGGFVVLGVVLVIAGLLIVAPDTGMFSLNKGYLRGQRAPSGPV